MFKRTWDDIKSIVSLTSKEKTAPNSLIVNGNIFTNKNYIAEILSVQILRLKSQKEKDILIHV